MANTGPTAWNSPDAFVGKAILSAYEPYAPISGSQYTSIAGPNQMAVRWVQPQPVAFKNFVMQNTLLAGVPGATSQASTGSEAYSYAMTAMLCGRQDYAANSTNLTPIVSGSFGLSASMGYSSTSQQFGMSWVTDSAGGTSNLTTTSNDAGWSNFINGPRAYSVPFAVTTLTAGEYWAVMGQASTSATSNSNVTLMTVSNLILQWGAAPGVGLLGQTTTAVTNFAGNQDYGLIGGAPAFSTTFALSTITNQIPRGPWFALSNA